MYGVHLDVGVLEFRCQINREHVDRGLGGVVSELPQWRDGARIHCLKCQRAEDAGEVDDPARIALLQQRQKFASQSDQGKQIDVEVRGLLIGRYKRRKEPVLIISDQSEYCVYIEQTLKAVKTRCRK